MEERDYSSVMNELKNKVKNATKDHEEALKNFEKAIKNAIEDMENQFAQLENLSASETPESNEEN